MSWDDTADRCGGLPIEQHQAAMEGARAVRRRLAMIAIDWHLKCAAGVEATCDALAARPRLEKRDPLTAVLAGTGSSRTGKPLAAT